MHRGPGKDVTSQPPLSVWISDTGAEVRVRLEGELDVETTSWFLRALEGARVAREGHVLELDLSELTFLDVAGVRALARVHDEVTSEGGLVRVRGLCDHRLPAARVLGLGNYLEDRSAGGDALGQGMPGHSTGTQSD